MFLLKAETCGHTSILLFACDAVVREIAQDAAGLCLVPSSAPEGMTLLPYRASKLPNWEQFCTRVFSPFEVFYSGAKCSRLTRSEQQQEQAWLSNLTADAVAQKAQSSDIRTLCMRWAVIQRKSPKMCRVRTGSPAPCISFCQFHLLFLTCCIIC